MVHPRDPAGVRLSVLSRDRARQSAIEPLVAAACPGRCGAARPDRAGKGIAGAADDEVARDRLRVADAAPAAVPGEIDMDMVVVERVRSGRQDGAEALARRQLDVVEEAALLGQAVPAVLHSHAAAIGKREGGDIERIAEGVLGDRRAALAVHRAARIGGNLPDLRDRLMEPFQRRRLHAVADPAIKHRDHRTRECRRRRHRRGAGIRPYRATRWCERNLLDRRPRSGRLRPLAHGPTPIHRRRVGTRIDAVRRLDRGRADRHRRARLSGRIARTRWRLGSVMARGRR